MVLYCVLISSCKLSLLCIYTYTPLDQDCYTLSALNLADGKRVDDTQQIASDSHDTVLAGMPHNGVLFGRIDNILHLLNLHVYV